MNNADYKLLTETCGLCQISHLSLVELKGDDRKEWLQGQATNDLRKLEIDGSIETCICTPTGQLLTNCTIWSLPDRFLMALPTKTLPAFMQRVQMMVIMEDVVARQVEHFTWLSIQGPTASQEVERLLGPGIWERVPGTVTVEGADAIVLPTNWTESGGWDFFSPGRFEGISTHFGTVSDEAFNTARLEAGLPLFGLDMNEKTLPPEMGPHFESRNISYEKGCYTGQEVLMRIHSRGHTNRSWVGLILDGEVRAGDTVSHSSRQDAGVITNAAFSPRFGFIAGAMVRNEAATEGEMVEVKSLTASIKAQVRAMPISRA